MSLLLLCMQCSLGAWTQLIMQCSQRMQHAHGQSFADVCPMPHVQAPYILIPGAPQTNGSSNGTTPSSLSVPLNENGVSTVTPPATPPVSAYCADLGIFQLAVGFCSRS